MKFKNIITITLIVFFTTGCATTGIPTFAQEENFEGLYLRGVFTWWEADEKYKLMETTKQRYSTQIDLIADGQPYDFKFADADWTPGLNCGYSHKSDQVILLGQYSDSDCESTDENFQFTPLETGRYEFIIDFSGFGSPEVQVNKIN